MSITNIASVINKLGLKKHSDKVFAYLSHSENPQSVTKISKSIGIERQLVYRAIYSLIERGYIKKIQTGKRPAYISLPVENILKDFNDTSKNISKLGSSNTAKSFVTEEFGEAAITRLFDDIIKESKKFSVFYKYTSEISSDFVDSFLSKDYRVKRDAKSLERKVISGLGYTKNKKPRLNRFIRVIDDSKYNLDQNVIEIIYNDALVFVDVDNLCVIRIKNKKMVEFKKQIFLHSYENSKKLQ